MQPTLEQTELARRLSLALVEGDGPNDIMHRLLGAVAEVLAVPRLVLYDYDERSDAFNLLYFRGHAADARSELQRRLRQLSLRPALGSEEPYAVTRGGEALVVPLYFQDTLEAVLLLDDPAAARGGGERLRPALRLVARFLGLFMSSMRLPVNQRERFLNPTVLERAREVQLSYLPASCAETEDYEIFGYNQSAALVGGDYFDYFCRRSSTLQLVVADACGHGMPAALTICAFRDLLHAGTHELEEIGTLFDRINRDLYASTGMLQYLTAVFCDYHERRGELLYLNAGHHRPLLVRADGAHEWLPGGGLPLGMFEDARYELASVAVKSGDLLVLFTDGIVDLQDGGERFFGTQGVCEAVLAHRASPLRLLARSVLARAEAFRGRAEADDDLTLFLLRLR